MKLMIDNCKTKELNIITDNMYSKMLLNINLIDIYFKVYE